MDSRLRSGLRALALGYAVRILPVVGIAGFAASAYGWLRLLQWSRRPWAALGLAGVLAVLAASAAQAAMPQAEAPRIAANMSEADLAAALAQLDASMSNPAYLLLAAATCAGLAAEAAGVAASRSSLFPRPPHYSYALLAAYALALAAPLAMGPGTRLSVARIRAGLLSGSLNSSAAVSMLYSAFAPYAYAELAAVVLSLAAYAALALAFYRAEKQAGA